MTIPVIINADDFGITDGVCKAIIELFDAGGVSTTSFMPAAIGAAGRVRDWGLSRFVDSVGVHLHLTSGVPLSPPSSVRSLIDPRTGAFGHLDALTGADPVEARDEWRRQIELAAELLGVSPTHLDSHRGVGRLPHLTETFLDLSVEYELPVRGGDDRFDARRRERGVPGPEILVRDWTGRGLGIDALKRRLLDLPPASTVAVVVAHPGYADANLAAISSMTIGREEDRNELDQLAQEGWLRDNGFVLVRYSSLPGEAV
jgi:predicted glycoside hydrolase/deacetylase ChbG (UPF0249 family)